MSSVALLACERQSELSWAMERWIPVDESNAEEKKVFVFRLRLHCANCLRLQRIPEQKIVTQTATSKRM